MFFDMGMIGFDQTAKPSMQASFRLVSLFAIYYGLQKPFKKINEAFVAQPAYAGVAA